MTRHIRCQWRLFTLAQAQQRLMALQLIEIFRIFSDRCHQIATESSWITFHILRSRNVCLLVLELHDTNLGWRTWLCSLPPAECWGNTRRQAFVISHNSIAICFFYPDYLRFIASFRTFSHKQNKRKWVEDTENPDPNFRISGFPIILLGFKKNEFGESVVYICGMRNTIKFRSTDTKKRHKGQQYHWSYSFESWLILGCCLVTPYAALNEGFWMGDEIEDLVRFLYTLSVFHCREWRKLCHLPP